jgi:hypothetical protein
LVALHEDELIGMMVVTVAAHRGKHRLELFIHPEHAGNLSTALVSRALHLLGSVPSKPVETTLDTSQSDVLEVLRNYGFVDTRTLLTLAKRFKT